MMLRHRSNEQGDAGVASLWRAAVKQVSGAGSLQALCACLDQVPAASVVGLDMLAQDLAFIGQQLHALSSHSPSTQSAAAAGTQQQQAPGLAPDVLHACLRFCKAVPDALCAAIQRPQQEQQQQHSRWRHSQRHHHRQQQQTQQQTQQPQQQQVLPAAAATALCSCLRQWADPMLFPALPGADGTRDLQGQEASDLPQAAVTALGALLPSQLPVISAHERAAVLALLLALVQPPTHNGGSSSSSGSSGRPDNTAASAVASARTDGKQAHTREDTQGSQHWTLACKAAVALTDIMSEALRNSSAAVAAAADAAAAPGNSTTSNSTTSNSATSSSSKPGSSLQPEEAASITAGLVVALSTSCGIRSSGAASSGSSGSRSGSACGAAGHSSSNGGAWSGSTGGANSSSRQQLCEGVLQSQYYASLLVALNHAVNSNKQGWQTHAGAITESLRKLFTYGTQQQQQQASEDEKPTDSAFTAAGTQPGESLVGIQQPVASQQPPKRKYVPPHARAAAAAVQSPSKQQQQQQQQRWQNSSDESEQSASDWSDVSDSECLQGSSSSSSRRTSSTSTSKDLQQQLKQQQQQLHDPIKAVRVRSALLQLLQVLVQADPRALHPYWAALLPSQAALQPAPLSPHLLTVLLYDPSDKVRLLAAGVLGALLEGPTARSLLAVAEAKTAHPNLRGFTTMSLSLGHMVLCLHAGLLAVVASWQQQQQQTQQQQTQQQQMQQQGGVLQVPAVLLTAVLRVLCVLVPVTPYERLPSTLLTDTVDSIWRLWQQQGQQPAPAAAAAAALQASKTVPAAAAAAAAASNGCTRQAGVQPLALSAAGAGGSSGVGHAPNNSSSIHVVAVLAQAFSTKKPHPALGRWLQDSIAAGSSDSSSSSRGAALIGSLLAAAAAAADCLLRIEALAALRGCCINYPAVIPRQDSARGFTAAAHTDSATLSSSTSSTHCAHSLQQQQQQQLCALLFAAVDVSVVAAAAQPSSARSTPRSSPRGPSTSSSPAAAAAGSGSTSPEVKAGQHAVRLLGDWLAAAAAGDADAAVSAGDRPQQQQQQQGTLSATWATQWGEVLQLLLSDSVWGHPSPVIRSAAAAVCGSLPAGVWLALPQHLRARLLAAAAATAAGADVTAVRAAACKLLGSCAVMPGVLGGHQQEEQQQQEQKEKQPQGGAACQGWALLQALSQCVSDEAVSVRLSAAWALSNVCDELRRQVVDLPQQQQQQQAASVAAASQHCNTAVCSGGSSLIGARQQQQQQLGVCEAVVGSPKMGAAELRVLCDAAGVAAGDTEKVRAHGVRAVGALLAAWQPCWGLDSSSSSSGVGGSVGTDGSSAKVCSAGSPQPAAADVTGAAAGTAAAAVAGTGTGPAGDWSWVPGWFKGAFGALQSCLAARSMKVVWNAACAAAAGLHNTSTLAVPAVADSTPALLRMLVVLVRDSSNFKIKTHAAAALAAPPNRAAYGEVFADSLLVLLAALQALQGSSSSSSVLLAAAADGQQAAAGGDGGLDDEGAFPNYRYIPGLQAQLESSLCHLLSLLQPSDASRLREQLRRHQPLLLGAVARACPLPPAGSEAGLMSATAAGQRQQQSQLLHVAAGAATGSSDGAQQPACAGGPGSRGLVAAVNPAAADRAEQSVIGSSQQEGKLAAAAAAGGGGGQASQQQQAQSALPADPFGQGGTGLSRDGAAGAGSKGKAATKLAGVADNSPSKAGALGWGAAAGTGAVASKGAVLAAAGHPAAVAGCENAALQGLCSVLGPSVLHAWTKQQVAA